MATVDAKCRQCRREGEKLFLKGDKCFTKCTLVKRNYVPGQHGLSRRGKPSDYSVMLREKQKVKRMYGMRETQFKSYFEKASARKGVTGEILLSILESRLDSVVYRMGFASSRAQAKQLVSHGLFSVNGRKVNIPSIILRPGDKISVIETKKNKNYFENLLKTKQREENSWVRVNRKDLSGEFISAPIREQLDPSIKEQLIVEFYSK
ncbi:MAG: 30S ribosomal protein S4 [Patescibacteria group bacterium]|nr:30S ribosomal protein S4 [Patescibacteria group bacterium]